jgi:RNA polymerase sigma-70 factor, ECF subfamily
MAFDADAPEPVDDRALLAGWRGGDRALGNQLFLRHIRGVSRFFRTKVPDAAEDLTQTTFLALVERDAGPATDVPFRAYLFGVARNQLLMHLRAKGRAAQRFDPLTHSAPDAGASPVRVAAAHEQQRALAAALQRVPVDYQVALELFYFEGLPVAEIASVLDRPAGTIKSLLSRGRALVRAELEALTSSAELLASLGNELERWMRSLPDVVGGDAAS